MSPDVIPVMGVIMGSLMITGSVWALAWYQVKKKEFEAKSGDVHLGQAVDALRDDVEQLADTQEHTRAQLVEMQERLDFAERLLTAGRAPPSD